MPGLVDAQGNPIPEEHERAAWESGAAHVLPGTTIHMVDSTGTLRAVPAEQIAAARAQGMVPAAAKAVEEHQLQAEHGGIGGQLATVGESAADMASLGGYGYAAGKLSPGYAKNLLARREANPVAHVAGSIVGLAPGLIDGGAEAEGAELLGEGAHALQGGEAAAHAAEAPGLARQALGAANSIAAAPMKAVGAVGSVVERGIARGLKSLGVAQGEGLGSRLAEKALTTGAAGAAEGAVFGVGTTLSESSLEGKDLTSEALVSGIGRNALFGGVLGAGMGAMSELGSAAIHAALPGSDELAAFAQRKAARAIGTSGKDIEKLGGLESNKFKSTMDEMLGYEYQTGANKGQRLFSSAQNVTDIHEGLRQAAQETGAAKRGIVEEIDQAIQSNPEVAAVAQPDVNAFMDRVKTEVLDKLRKSDVMGQRRMADKIEKEIQPLREAYEATQKWAADEAAGVSHPPGASDNLDVNVGAFDKSTMRPESMAHLRSENADPDRLGIPRIEVYPDATSLADGRHRLSLAFERGERSAKVNVVHLDGEGNVVSEAVHDVSLSNTPSKNWREAVSVAPSAPEPITFARLDKFEQDLGKRIYGENVKGAGIQVAPKGAKQLERVRGILSDFQDQNAERALAAMGEDPTQLATLNRQYSSFANLEKIAGREAGKAAKNRLASPTDHALGLSMFLGSLLSGNVGALGSMAFGAAASIANNFARTRGNSILADIAYRTSKMDNLLENTAHALTLSPESLARPLEAAEEIAHHKAREELHESDYVPLGIKALGKDFEETSKRVQDLAEPVAQHEQLTKATESIAPHYPEQAAAMSAKLLAIYQHLAATLPQPIGSNTLSPMASRGMVPPREQARFLSRVNAALNPAKVIADIGKGKLDKDAVDTLKETYPATFGVLRQKVMTNLAGSKEELPFQRVIHVGMVFDFPSDSSLGPRLAGIQQTIQEISAPPNGAPPGSPGPTKRARPGKANIGKSLALPGAAIAGAH